MEPRPCSCGGPRLRRAPDPTGSTRERIEFERALMRPNQAAIDAAIGLFLEVGFPDEIAKSGAMPDPGARRITVEAFEVKLQKIMTKLMEGPASPAQKAARDYMARFTILGEEYGSKQVGLAVAGFGAETPPGIVIEYDLPIPIEVREALIENTGDLIKKVSTDLQARIVGIIREARLDGKGVRETAKILQERTGFSTNRSRMIARTESNRAFNLAAEYRYQGHGIEMMEWNSADDERTAGDICSELNGQRFPVRGIHPPMPAHPQCRCAWIPVIGYEPTRKTREVYFLPSREILEGMDPIERRQMLIGPSPVYPWDGTRDDPIPA